MKMLKVISCLLLGQLLFATTFAAEACLFVQGDNSGFCYVNDTNVASPLTFKVTEAAAAAGFNDQHQETQIVNKGEASVALMLNIAELQSHSPATLTADLKVNGQTAANCHLTETAKSARAVSSPTIISVRKNAGGFFCTR